MGEHCIEWENVFWEKVETLLDVIVVLLLFYPFLQAQWLRRVPHDIPIENLLRPGLYYMQYVKQKLSEYLVFIY